jgi:hypothetical protein
MSNLHINEGFLHYEFSGKIYKITSCKEISIDTQAVEVSQLFNGQDRTQGLVYSKGLTQPNEASFILHNVEKDLFNLMQANFKKKEKIGIYFVADNGSTRNYTSAVIKSQPIQLKVVETEDAFDISLKITCSEIVEKMV